MEEEREGGREAGGGRERQREKYRLHMQTHSQCSPLSQPKTSVSTKWLEMPLTQGSQ